MHWCRYCFCGLPRSFSVTNPVRMSFFLCFVQWFVRFCLGEQHRLQGNHFSVIGVVTRLLSARQS